MEALEVLIGLILAATLLAAAARRVGAPYPVFLALGGALLALVPGAPTFTVLPELALALFVAPILLDAAYDASPRDLRDNWAPVTGLVVVAVGLTTLAVAVVARALIPALPWAPAFALGAVVAPPDAAAATAVLRQLKPPHRLLTILEGESLLNDASALLIYRLAVGAVAAGSFSIGAVAPTFLLAVVGSLVVGPALAWFFMRLSDHVRHVPTAIILQFVSTFGVWILADRIGLSGVLTMVCYAITVARTAPERIPARMRIPSYAVWETVVFVLNVLAFVFIGLQIRPILASLEPGLRSRYFTVAAVVLATVILVRIAWVFGYVGVARAIMKLDTRVRSACQARAMKSNIRLRCSSKFEGTPTGASGRASWERSCSCILARRRSISRTDSRYSSTLLRSEAPSSSLSCLARPETESSRLAVSETIWTRSWAVSPWPNSL